MARKNNFLIIVLADNNTDNDNKLMLVIFCSNQTFLYILQLIFSLNLVMKLSDSFELQG